MDVFITNPDGYYTAQQQRTARVKCCHRLNPDWSVYPIKHRYKQTSAIKSLPPFFFFFYNSSCPFDFVVMHNIVGIKALALSNLLNLL